MDREAWQAAVHGVTESQTQPINQHFYFHTFTNVGPGQIRSKATFEKQDSRVSHLKKQDQKKKKKNKLSLELTSSGTPAPMSLPLKGCLLFVSSSLLLSVHSNQSSILNTPELFIRVKGLNAAKF